MSKQASMLNVASMPKLPLLQLHQLYAISPAIYMGYSTNQGGSGTVLLIMMEQAKLLNQQATSSANLAGWSAQSLLIQIQAPARDCFKRC
jgi:hypothetical protein